MIYLIIGAVVLLGVVGFIYLKRKIDSINLVEKEPMTGVRSLFSTLYGKP